MSTHYTLIGSLCCSRGRGVAVIQRHGLGANVGDGNDGLGQTHQGSDVTLHAGDVCGDLSVQDTLVAQLSLDATEPAVHVIAELAHLSHREGVGVSQLDFSLQLGDSSGLCGFVPVNPVVLIATAVAVASTRQQVTQTAVQNAKCGASNRFIPLLPMALTIS